MKRQKGGIGVATYVFMLVSLFFFAMAVWLYVSGSVVVGKSLPDRYGKGAGGTEVLTVSFLFFVGTIFAVFPILDLIEHLKTKDKRKGSR